MTDTLTGLRAAVLFLQGKQIFHIISGFTEGEGRRQRLLRLKDFCVEIH